MKQQKKNKKLKSIPLDLPINIDGSSFEFKQAKIDRDTSINAEALPDQSGIYIFVTKNKFKMASSVFYKEVTGVFQKNNTEYRAIVSVPPYNGALNEGELIFDKDKIFYIGSACSIKSRICEHWNSEKINNTTSLKLGFSSRKPVKKHLKLYYICIEKGYRKIESALRKEYGSYFGK